DLESASAAPRGGSHEAVGREIDARVGRSGPERRTLRSRLTPHVPDLLPVADAECFGAHERTVCGMEIDKGRRRPAPETPALPSRTAHAPDLNSLRDASGGRVARCVRPRERDHAFPRAIPEKRYGRILHEIHI